MSNNKNFHLPPEDGVKKAPPQNTENGNGSDENLQERLKKWRKEQHHIASKVIIHDDPPSTTTSDGRFQFLESQSYDGSTSSATLYGGVDVSFPENDSDMAVAVYVIVRNDSSKTLIYRDQLYFDLQLPYVSSYLSFREIEPLEHLVQKQMKIRPDITPSVILVDGNGILHARKAGIACFLGVRTGIKTIGVGKTLYCQGGLTKEGVKIGVGSSVKELFKHCRNNDSKVTESEDSVMVMDQQFIEAGAPPPQSDDEKISREEMTNMVQSISQYYNGFAIKLRGDDGTIWGAALLCHGGRVTSKGCIKKRQEQGGGGSSGTKNPIYISIGHDVSLQEAVQICCDLSLARIPEPVRMADLEGRRLLREAPPRRGGEASSDVAAIGSKDVAETRTAGATVVPPT